MSDWALRGGNVTEWKGGVTLGSSGSVVTASSTANTKGAYVELIASTARPYSGMMLTTFVGFGVIDTLLDIAFGGAGSETDIITNILGSGGREQNNYKAFPIPVPASTRVSARCQATVGSKVTGITVGFVAADFIASSPFGGVDTLGANTGDSGGTGVDPGGTIDTKGSYAEIISSTTRPYKALAIAIGTRNNSATRFINFLLDIAVGGAGSEEDILKEIWLRESAGTGADQIEPTSIGPVPVYIPSGSRVAARAQAGSNNSPDRLFDVVLYGFY